MDWSLILTWPYITQLACQVWGGLGCRVARGQGQVLEQTHRWVRCRTLRWHQPLRWLHDRQIQIQGANTRESMWRTWRRGQANTRLPTGTLTTASGRRDWDMDRGRTLGRRRTKSRTHSLKQWPSSHVYPFPFSSFSSTHFLYLSLYQGDCHQQYVNLLSCQFKLKSSLLGRSHPTQYKQPCLGHCT